MYIGSRGPLEYIADEFNLTSPAVSRMSGSSNLIVFVIVGRWPYSCCFVGGCLQDLFSIARQHSCVIAVKLFLHYVLISVHVLHPYSSTDTAAAWRKPVLFYQSGLTSI